MKSKEIFKKKNFENSNQNRFNFFFAFAIGILVILTSKLFGWSFSQEEFQNFLSSKEESKIPKYWAYVFQNGIPLEVFELPIDCLSV